MVIVLVCVLVVVTILRKVRRGSLFWWRKGNRDS